jgi:hypothetical protein
LISLLFSLSTISAGVFLGAPTPGHPVAPWPESRESVTGRHAKPTTTVTAVGFQLMRKWSPTVEMNADL